MKKNKVIYFTIMIFVVLSAILMTVGTVVIMQTTDSMEALFEVAKPPHFLQMHTGEVNQEAIDAMVKENKNVVAQETVEMQNIDAASIWYQKSGDGELLSMSGNMMDNGFVKQTKQFDYLLDEKNEVINEKNGSVGVPISYRDQYGLELGDKLILSQGNFYKEYTIAQFVRDAQMASTMASSTRFLLSDEDYEEVKVTIGEPEYILEFRFKEESYASAFQKEYEKEVDMPKNGQAITYPLIKLVNALASGLTAGMLILVSALLIFIAGFVLKYTILAALEEEVHDIGVLKAIGIADRDIEKQYLKKYRTIAVIGCVIGYVLGLLASGLFTRNIGVMFGEKKLGILEMVVPVFTVALVYLLILFSAKRVLHRIRKITVVNALVMGKMNAKEKEKRVWQFGMKKWCQRHINAYLAMKELWVEKKNWLVICILFLLVSNIILNPLNLIHTFQSPAFSNYMGTPQCDVEMILQAKDRLDEKCKEVLSEVEADSRIEDARLYAYGKYQVKGRDGEENILIESGDYSRFTTNCIVGRMPKEEGEIALSYLNQKKFGKAVGDTIEIVRNDKNEKYVVCGIYQDITSGGYTAKVYGTGPANEAQKYMILCDCKESELIETVAADYDQKYDFAKSLPMNAYTEQTFGSVISSFENATGLILFIAMLIATLILLLFLKLQTTKKQKEKALLGILGFSKKDITKQYLIKASVMATLGISIGVVVANFVGAKLIGAALSFAGLAIANFTYIISPAINFLVCPIGLLIMTQIVTACYIHLKSNKKEIMMMQE